MVLGVEVSGGVSAKLVATCAFCGVFREYAAGITMASPHGTTVLVADLPAYWFRYIERGVDGDIINEAITCLQCSLECDGEDGWLKSPDPQRYVWRGR